MFWNPQVVLREILAMLVGAGLVSACLAQQDFAADRRRMVEEIDAELASSPNSGGVARLDPRVRAAMDEVPPAPNSCRLSTAPPPTKTSRFRSAMRRRFRSRLWSR